MSMERIEEENRHSEVVREIEIKEGVEIVWLKSSPQALEEKIKPPNPKDDLDDFVLDSI